MTISDREIETRPREGVVHVRRTHPGDPQFEYWLDQRQKYMQRMGWHLDSEYDYYDDDPQTAHILINDEQDRLIVGMRLTPVANYQESLSWQMVGPSQSVREAVVQSRELDPTQPVWDLTRLVQGDTRFAPEVNHEAIGRLFGEGLIASGATDEQEPTWVFAITEPLFRVLTASGMHLRQLGKDRIQPDDRTDSIFGYVRTLQDLHDSVSSSIARTTIGVLQDG